MITKGMMSSNDHTWETPQELFNELHKEFNFNIDVCALPHNAKLKNYYSPKEDGLKQEWEGVAWCNPPYGREIKKWVKKAYEESLKGNIVVMLIPARTDTSYFHDYIYHKAELRFLRGRVKFLQNGKQLQSAPFPSMVVVFRGGR